MRILVLGGTGPTGQAVIREALAHSHIVVVYARSPEKLSEDISSNPSVVIIKGQLSDSDNVSKAMEGVHAVISALGPKVTKGPLYPSGTPLAHAYSSIIDIMHKHNVKRLIALGTASIKDPNDKFDSKFWALINAVATLARNAYKEMVAIGEVIRAEGDKLVWTIARVPVLGSQDSKEVVAGYVGDGKTGVFLTRAAFGAFLIQELEKNEWSRKAPLISSP
jgi:nucleoside-diphosphate-sugar epimerase